MNYKDYITINPNKRSGKPCIRNLRMTVTDVLEYLASGMSEDEILDNFPDLTREDIGRVWLLRLTERNLATVSSYEIAV